MSGDVLMKVNANASGYRFSRGFAPSALTGSLAHEVLGLIDNIAHEPPPTLRHHHHQQQRIDIGSGGGKLTPSSPSAFGFNLFDGNVCWNGNCFRSPESIGQADRRSTTSSTANGTQRLTALDVVGRRLPVAASDGFDVRQVSSFSSSSSVGGIKSSRGDVMSDSCYFSSSLSSSLSSSTSSSSSTDGLAATSGGTSNDQPLTPAGATTGNMGTYSWMQGGPVPSPPPTSSGQSHHHHHSAPVNHHGDVDDDVERMQLNAVRPSANMTECVTVPSSEHVAEIVGRQGCKIKALRNKTNTYIKTPARGEDPVFVITGRREDVSTARQEILTAADHFSQIRASRRATAGTGGAGPGSTPTTGVSAVPLPTSPALTSSPMSGSPTSGLPPPVSMSSFDRGHTNTNAAHSAAGTCQMTCEVRVPVRVVGLVVGPKGATVKRIQAETGTYIVTPSRGTDPVFEIIGSPENVDRARREIESYVVSHGGGSGGSGGSGGGGGGRPALSTSTGATTPSGSGSMTARCSIRATPQTECRPQLGSVSTWRQLLAENGVVECNSSMSAASPGEGREGTSPNATTLNAQRTDYGYMGLHNCFSNRLHLDDPETEVMSKAIDSNKLTHFHLEGLDELSAHILLLQAAAAEANSAIDAQRQRLPLFGAQDTAYDVLTAAEQLIEAGVTASRCPSSPFEPLPASSTWSRPGVPNGIHQLTSEASNLFDVWGSSNHNPMPSAVFRQHPGGFVAEGPPSWFSGKAEVMSSSSSSSSNNAGNRMNCCDDVIVNRWIENQSSSSSLESPMTSSSSSSAVCLL